MKKTGLVITILSVVATGICFITYRHTKSNALLATAIALGTTSYHILMRLGVGFVVNKIMKNRADYTKRWYQCRPWEPKLYERLRVKRWKRHMPTYDSRLFDRKTHSWDEIAQASCQAEIVHEVIVVLSFLPLLSAPYLGATVTFVITSILAALLDMMFVIIQRYNRPRLLRLRNR